MIAAEEAGDRLSEEELVATCTLLLFAGHETTVNLIASGTLALLEHPKQRELLQREPGRMKAAVEELLRYTSPVETATERYTTEDVELSGIRIPRGELFPDDLLNNPDYVSNGKFTPTGLQQIKKAMPHADFSKFDADPDVNKMPDLFTVKTLVNYIQTKLAA